MPGRPPRRVGARIDNAANVFESQDVLFVAPQCIFDLRLVQDGVDAAQPVRVAVGHCVQAAKRVGKIRQRIAVGPASLRLSRCEDRVIDCSFGLLAPAKVKRQQFRDLLGTTVVESFERLSDRGMMGAAMPFEQAAISGFLGQGMAKGIDRPLSLDALVDEFETAKLTQLVLQRCRAMPQRREQT